MAHAGNVVAPHIRGQRNVTVGARAHQVRRNAQRIELGRPEGLDHFGTRVGRAAAAQQAGRGASPRFVGVITPPEHPLAPGSYISAAPLGAANLMFIASWRAAMLVFMPSNTRRPRSSWLNPRWTSCAGSCRTANYPAQSRGLVHGRSQGISRPVAAQERHQVTRRSKANSVYGRVFGDVGQFVEEIPVEAAFETEHAGIRCSRKGL